MRNFSWLYLTLLGTYSVSYANVVRDPEQTNIEPKPSIDQKELFEDQLRQQKLLENTAKQQQTQHTVKRYTGKELMQNPEILEEMFLTALISPNKAVLPTYIKLYQKVNNYDQSLIDWANAILQRDSSLNESVSGYRKLISHFPENNFIRYQLAETLFYNQEFEAAKDQFEKLRTSSTILPNDIAVIDNYLSTINRKEHWNFSFGATFLNDKNLANAAKPGTTVVLPTGQKITYSSPRQSGQGISAWIGADKQWNLSNGKYLAFESSASGKYYWDNKRYNDLNTHIGFGLGYSNARFTTQITPYFDKRWYAGGINSGKALNQYTTTYGGDLVFNYWLTQKFKYSFNYNYGYESYNKLAYSKQYNGAIHSFTNSLMYFPSVTQYWSLSLDTSKKLAKDKTNAYDRIGIRVGWGQEWPLGISTSLTLGAGKRFYKEKTFFGPKQKNKEYSASISLWHKNIHFKGFTPKLTFNYTKTDSNIAIYSYDKSQLFFNVGKSF